MISIVFLSLGIITGLGLSFYPLFIFKSKQEYSVLNSFPFEGSKTIRQRYIMVVLTILLALFTDFGIITSITKINYISMISSGIFYTLGCIGLVGMMLVKFDNYKSHLFTTIMSILGFSGGNISLGACCIIAQGSNLPFEIPNYICYILALISLLFIILLTSSKLNRWMSLQKTEVDGKTIYIRPKFNPLCFGEWVNIYLVVLTQILFLISSIITYIN